MNLFRNPKWDQFSRISYGFSTVADCRFPSHAEDVLNFMKPFNGKGEALLLKQVHGASVIEAQTSYVLPELQVADGLITNLPEKLLTIKTADCVPVLFYDPVKQAVGAVHSGWKGTIGGISLEAVRLMSERYGSIARDIHVLLGPAIKACCYEIQNDVAKLFRSYENALVERENKVFLEQKKAIRQDLLSAGVLNIDNIDFCTGCRPDLLCSWRTQKTEKRLYAAIMLNKI